MTEITQVSSNYCFGGYQNVYSHESKELGCKMNFAVYIPPAAEDKEVPVLYWLSGLTCTEQNFITKSGFQKYAAQHGLLVVAPDTSPRGCKIAGEDESYDLGTGAGFYVDATQDPWKKNYRMYSYITVELPQIISANFAALPEKPSIMGHSMGGHGALICALKNPGLYASVSAFAPICNPMACPWGQKAFSAYLGPSQSTWQSYDATSLIKEYQGPRLQILIDQGRSDNFYEQKQLLPENLVEACRDKADGVEVILRVHDNYDHSYYFISSFIEQHIAHHAKVAKQLK